MSRQQENLANQRKVAVNFLRVQGGVESIRFTDEGNRPGLGVPWSVNAVVTIDRVDYQMILGMRSIGGDPLPDIAPGTPPDPTIVIFSDGSSEVIRADATADFVTVARKRTGPRPQANNVKKFVGRAHARLDEGGHAAARMEAVGYPPGPLLTMWAGMAQAHV